jgi:hypothetical protein
MFDLEWRGDLTVFILSTQWVIAQPWAANSSLFCQQLTFIAPHLLAT